MFNISIEETDLKNFRLEINKSIAESEELQTSEDDEWVAATTSDEEELATQTGCDDA